MRRENIGKLDLMNGYELINFCKYILKSDSNFTIGIQAMNSWLKTYLIFRYYFWSSTLNFYLYILNKLLIVNLALLLIPPGN